MGDEEPHDVPQDGHHNARSEILLVLDAMEVEHRNTIEGVDEVQTVSESDHLREEHKHPENHRPLLACPSHRVLVMFDVLILSIITR